MEVPKKKTNDNVWLTQVLRYCYQLPQESPERTALLIMSELGDIAKCLTHATHYGPEGYQSEQMIACADARTMIGLLIEQLGFDLREVDAFGIERLKARVDDIRKRGILEVEKG